MLNAARANEPEAAGAALPLDLQWSAPATCPAAVDVELRIRAHLGREGIEPDPNAPVATVRATITNVDGRHELALEIETAAGTTGMQAGDETCDSLAELVAIKVSLAIDPVETARELLTEAKPQAPVSEPAPAQPPSPRPRPARPSANPSRPVLHLHLAPLVGAGVLASVEVGGFAGLGATGRLWQVTAGLSAASGPGERLSEPRDARVSMSRVLGAVTACVLPGAGNVVFPACVGFDAGGLRARGVGLANDRTAWSPLLGLSVEAGFSWPRDRVVRLMVRARTRFHALRPSFSVGGLGEIHRAGVVSGQVLVGVETIFQRRSRRVAPRPRPRHGGR